MANQREGAAEKALKEKQKVWRIYSIARAARRRELYREHPMGPALLEFAQRLNRLEAGQAEAFLNYVRESNRGWMLTAPPEIRAEALSLVSERIQRIRLRSGLAPFDDQIPFGNPGEEADDVFRLCREELS